MSQMSRGLLGRWTASTWTEEPNNYRRDTWTKGGRDARGAASWTAHHSGSAWPKGNFNIVGFRWAVSSTAVPQLILETCAGRKSPVPDAPDHIEGVIHLRGKIVFHHRLCANGSGKANHAHRHNRILTWI